MPKKEEETRQREYLAQADGFVKDLEALREKYPMIGPVGVHKITLAVLGCVAPDMPGVQLEDHVIVIYHQDGTLACAFPAAFA